VLAVPGSIPITIIPNTILRPGPDASWGIRRIDVRSP
jgi:hypothetical protein